MYHLHRYQNRNCRKSNSTQLPKPLTDSFLHEEYKHWLYKPRLDFSH